MSANAQDYSLAPPVKAVTAGPLFHWFGYYDKFPWNQSQHLLLSNEIDFMDRILQAGDTINVGFVDLAAGTEFHPIAETPAWCWQQGTMLQWLGSDPERKCIYNSVEDGQYVSVIHDVQSGQTRTLPRPVYAVSRDGTQAVGNNFARVARTRPGYGYLALPDPTEGVDAPDDDGVWWMDLATSENRLIISLEQIVNTRHQASMDEGESWVNHLQFNTDGSRFLFMHRWRVPATGSHWTRLLTANPDGSDICVLNEFEMTSHFDWMGTDHILAWARHRQIGDKYFLYRDQTPWFEVVGEDVFTCDGHCSYSPDMRFILTDTYPDGEEKRTLIIYDTVTGSRADIGRFLSPKKYSGEIRCDLHPRWSRDGKQVCFDSIHEGPRQIYVIDVAEVLEQVMQG
jgi:hypothetical protein